MLSGARRIRRSPGGDRGSSVRRSRLRRGRGSKHGRRSRRLPLPSREPRQLPSGEARTRQSPLPPGSSSSPSASSWSVCRPGSLTRRAGCIRGGCGSSFRGSPQHVSPPFSARPRHNGGSACRERRTESGRCCHSPAGGGEVTARLPHPSRDRIAGSTLLDRRSGPGGSSAIVGRSQGWARARDGRRRAVASSSDRAGTHRRLPATRGWPAGARCRCRPRWRSSSAAPARAGRGSVAVTRRRCARPTDSFR